tara:strand:+ start:106 stop:330 length:225 start_codon:yes stop_codon:yes gene_type:complete
MKSFNIDAILPWELGLVIIMIGIIFIIIGVKQSRKLYDDLNKIPITKPTTKILFGSAGCIFGAIQLLPLIKMLN